MNFNEKMLKVFSNKIAFYISSGFFLLAALLRVIFYICNEGDSFSFTTFTLLALVFVFNALSFAAVLAKNKNMIIISVTGFLIIALTFSATYFDYWGLNVANDIFSIIYFLVYLGCFVCNCYLFSVSKPHPTMIKVFQGLAISYVVITLAWDILWIILMNNNYETLDTILSGITVIAVTYELIGIHLRVNTYRIKREESKE